jgi:DNA uptake protein ComE-like DNA-binding protein
MRRISPASARRLVAARSQWFAGLVFAAALAWTAVTMANPPQNKSKKVKQEPKAGTKYDIADSKKKLAEAREKAGPDSETATAKTGPIDLNRATLDELKAVAGITEEIAVQIIDRRKSKPFKSVSELIELDAVDKSLLAKIRPSVKVEGRK